MKSLLIFVFLSFSSLVAGPGGNWYILGNHHKCVDIQRVLKRSWPDLPVINNPDEFIAVMEKKGLKPRKEVDSNGGVMVSLHEKPFMDQAIVFTTEETRKKMGIELARSPAPTEAKWLVLSHDDGPQDIDQAMFKGMGIRGTIKSPDDLMKALKKMGRNPRKEIKAGFMVAVLEEELGIAMGFVLEEGGFISMP